MEKTSAYVLAKNTMISLNKARTREGVREVSAAEGSRGASEPYSSVCWTSLVPRTWWLRSSGTKVVLDFRMGCEKMIWDASGST